MAHKPERFLFKAGIFLFFVLFAFLCAPCRNVSAASKYAVKIDLSEKPYKVKRETDITKVLQKALDKAAEMGTPEKPGLVMVPWGTYYISNSLVIRSNTILYLNQYTTIKKRPNEFFSKMLRVPDPDENTPGGYAAYSNITVSGGTWDNCYVYTSCEGRGTTGSLFFFAHTTGLKIKNCTIRNVYGTHAIEIGGVKDCLISNCTIYGFKADSENIAKEAIQIDVCHDNNIFPSGAPFDDTPCTEVTISDCEIYDYPRAVGSHIAVSGIYHRNITIKNNYFHDIKNAAIYGYNYIGMTVSDNTLKNVGSGVVMRNCALDGADTFFPRLEGVKGTKAAKGEYNLTITNNVITTSDRSQEIVTDDPGSMDTVAKAKGILIYGEESRPIKNVEIIQNRINSSNCGIVLYYVGNSNVEANIINRTKGAADVSATTFVEEGIRLNTCKNVRLNKNKITATSDVKFENGIGIRYGSGNILEWNVISAVSKNGIYIYDDSVRGNNNTVKNSGLHGIAVASGSQLVLTAGDNIWTTGGNGVCATGSSKVFLNGTTILACGQSGIALGTKAGAELDSVSITKCKEYGIQLGNQTPVEIQGKSKILSNVLGGILAKQSPYTISGNSKVQSVIEADSL